MSDLVCTTPMCTSGQASVNAMRSTYDQLSNDANFAKEFYGPTVQSIESAFNENYSWYDPYIPFNPVCCDIADIGRQADALTASMLKSVGAADPGTGPSSEKPPLDLATLATLGIIALIAVSVSNVARR